jgi:hypothetical protein
MLTSGPDHFALLVTNIKKTDRAMSALHHLINTMQETDASEVVQ